MTPCFQSSSHMRNTRANSYSSTLAEVEFITHSTQTLPCAEVINQSKPFIPIPEQLKECPTRSNLHHRHGSYHHQRSSTQNQNKILSHQLQTPTSSAQTTPPEPTPLSPAAATPSSSRRLLDTATETSGSTSRWRGSYAATWRNGSGCCGRR